MTKYGFNVMDELKSLLYDYYNNKDLRDYSDEHFFEEVRSIVKNCESNKLFEQKFVSYKK